jgi:hypothetical protein
MFHLRNTKFICKNNSDLFCFVCIKLLTTPKRRVITKTVKSAYKQHFGLQLVTDDWSPHFICPSCHTHLTKLNRGEMRPTFFTTPAIWRKPMDHPHDCFFCEVKITGYKYDERDNISYPLVYSVTYPTNYEERDNSQIPIESNFSRSFTQLGEETTVS